jgi:hypothetical protein
MYQRTLSVTILGDLMAGVYHPSYEAQRDGDFVTDSINESAFVWIGSLAGFHILLRMGRALAYGRCSSAARCHGGFLPPRRVEESHAQAGCRSAFAIVPDAGTGGLVL